MKVEGQVRIPSGCAISGIFSKSGNRFNGESIIKSISAMHDRSNGLGGGFAGSAFIQTTRITMLSIFSTIRSRQRKNAKNIWTGVLTLSTCQKYRQEKPIKSPTRR